MDVLSILLIILIAYIVYILLDYNSEKANNIKIHNIFNSKEPKLKSALKKSNNKKNKKVRFSVDNIINDVTSWMSSNKSDKNIVKPSINPNFIDIKFHNDYRDVITAINNIVPDKKQLFNLANIPLVYTEPEAAEVKNLINDFVGVLNNNLQTQVPKQRNSNSGWDEAIPDPTVKSGWDQVQCALGLQPNLWSKGAQGSRLKVVDIPYVQKRETEDEICYRCDIVLQKVGVSDQMMIRGSFVQDKRPLHDENNFFINKDIEMKVMIENVYIVGYLSKDGSDAKLLYDGQATKYYDYNKMEYNDMTDPKYIQSILMKKYESNAQEVEQRNAMLDEEGQDFHRTLPNIYDFSNIKGTRTIFDDMNKPKIFY